MKRLLLALTLITACGAAAAEESEIYKAGKEKALMCGGCHGEDGNSVVPMFPKLAGLDPRYIYTQLMAFRTGKRQDLMMAPMTMDLSEEDMHNLALYFSSQKRTLDMPEAPPEVVAQGEQLFRGIGKETRVPACAGCHGPRGDGMPQAGYPYLRGQHAAYVAKQLRDFKAGTRANDPTRMMRATATMLTDEEIEAVAQYISGLQ